MIGSSAAPEQERWNRKYRDKGPKVSGTDPAQWLVSHRPLLDALPRGRALDVACGTGRHALYLARLGFTVDALDISDVAIALLHDRVRQEGLPVHPRRCDLTSEKLPQRRYEVVLNFNYLERDLFSGLKEALKVGGLLFFETFTRDDAFAARHPVNPAFTLEAGELRAAFSDLEVLDYRETTLFADEPEKARAVASLVARKTTDPAGRGDTDGPYPTAEKRRLMPKRF